MKKLFGSIGLLGLLIGFASVGQAGTPQDSFYSGQAPFSNTSIVGSTGTANATSALSVTLAPGSVNGASCRNCFTKFFVQIPTTTIINIVDGTSSGTTVYAVDGLGLGASGVNSVQLTEDHLGPLCTTAGNSTVINVSSAGTLVHQMVNYEGYTACGGTNNKGL